MRIAIIRLSALGDIVHTVGFLEAVKKHCPDARIEWYVDSHFSEILEDQPYVDYIHPLPLKQAIKARSFCTIKNMIRNLKSQDPYDVIIDVQGLIKSAMVGWFLKGEYWGFAKDSIREPLAALFYGKKVSIGYEKHILERNAALFASALDMTLEKEQLNHKAPALGYSEESLEQVQTCLKKEDKNIVLILGASKAAKKYPKEQFLEVAQSLKRHIIPLWYSEEEKHNAEWLKAHYANCSVPEGRSLDFAKALIAQVDLVIGGDTGPTHMAWALNTPSITLFGNTPLERFCMKTEMNQCLSASHVTRTKGFDQDDFSIREISSQQIVECAQELL